MCRGKETQFQVTENLNGIAQWSRVKTLEWISLCICQLCKPVKTQLHMAENLNNLI